MDICFWILSDFARVMHDVFCDDFPRAVMPEVFDDRSVIDDFRAQCSMKCEVIGSFPRAVMREIFDHRSVISNFCAQRAMTYEVIGHFPRTMREI